MDEQGEVHIKARFTLNLNFATLHMHTQALAPQVQTSLRKRYALSRPWWKTVCNVEGD